MADEDWCKFRYLDASALVKLYVAEPHSDVMHAYKNSRPKPFQATSLCLAEAFNVLKRKWLKKDISIETYLGAVQLLTVDVWGGVIEPQEYGLRDPFLQKDVEQLVTDHNIDLSDALQLLTILRGPHSGLVGDSSSVLVTADESLERAARHEGIRVWNCRTGQAPAWA